HRLCELRLPGRSGCWNLSVINSVKKVQPSFAQVDFTQLPRGKESSHESKKLYRSIDESDLCTGRAVHGRCLVGNSCPACPERSESLSAYSVFIIFWVR